MLIEKTKQLKLGPTNDDDLGPVINERQLNNMLDCIKKAVWMKEMNLSFWYFLHWIRNYR